MATHVATLWLRENWGELGDYDNQWVAANSRGVIMNHETFDHVINVLRSENIDFAAVVLAFVTFDVVQ